MEVFSDPNQTRGRVRHARGQGKRIGFVPTMGYLHEGHLSLVRAARKECDFVAASIFVNPAQFGQNEDLEKYPRDFERDEALLTSVGTDLLFYPDKEKLYPPGFSTTVRVEGLTDHLCGASRPWHFPGVALIVSKLFNIVEPDAAFFGQKDFQQAEVIRRMARDLDFPVEIRACPIVREPDGLAMSSRNTYLRQDERQQALVLIRALGEANRLCIEGVSEAEELRARMQEVIASAPLARIDYAEVVDRATLKPTEESYPGTVALVAAFFGVTRLIDNHVLGEPFPVEFSS